jgi:hypothetical protein
MKKKRFSAERIVGVLKQVEVGVPVVEVTFKVGSARDALPMEGEVRPSGGGSGSAEEAPTGREPAAHAVGG